MRVVFLGNHTVGIKALEAIGETEEVAGVIAHPHDPEDGARYLSVYEFALQRGWNVIRGTGKDPATENFVIAAQPDLLWVTDYRYLLPPSLLSIAPLGAVNLHPSLLPKYRGRAPINWAILNGETILGLTAHFIDEGMDTGDIIAQESFELKEDQDVGDALEILYPLYSALTRRVLTYFRTGQIPRTKQDHRQATTYPRRRPEDGLIDWHKTAKEVLCLIRAVAPPYPGAFTYLNGKRLFIYKAKRNNEPHRYGNPGRILPNGEICCSEGTILPIRYAWEDSSQGISNSPDISSFAGEIAK